MVSSKHPEGRSPDETQDTGWSSSIERGSVRGGAGRGSSRHVTNGGVRRAMAPGCRLSNLSDRGLFSVTLCAMIDRSNQRGPTPRRLLCGESKERDLPRPGEGECSASAGHARSREVWGPFRFRFRFPFPRGETHPCRPFFGNAPTGQVMTALQGGPWSGLRLTVNRGAWNPCAAWPELR